MRLHKDRNIYFLAQRYVQLCYRFSQAHETKIYHVQFEIHCSLMCIYPSYNMAHLNPVLIEHAEAFTGRTNPGILRRQFSLHES